MAFALVFPGQGSQRVGMLSALRSFDGMERLLDAAEGLSELPLRAIAEDGPDTSLADTRASQPLLFLADWAWGRSIIQAGARPAALAGHSLGEFAALAIADVFSVEAGLELVVARSRLMAVAADANPGGMSAVLGMDNAAVAEAVSGLAGIWIANDNAPGQVIISGTHDGLELATQALTAAGARRVVPLRVAGAFHSPLMQPAAEAFEREYLSTAAFSDARIPVVSNALPEPSRDAQILRDHLAKQIVTPVRWTETMAALAEMDVSLLAEAGPGGVLTGLTRHIDGLRAVNVEESGVDAVIEEVAQS